MRSRWVYHRSWRSVLPVSWLIVSVDGCIHCPWRRWWEILVLGGGNPGHRGLWLCVSGKRGLIVCWQGGGANSGVGRDWCGWISGILCALWYQVIALTPSVNCEYFTSPFILGISQAWL